MTIMIGIANNFNNYYNNNVTSILVFYKNVMMH